MNPSSLPLYLLILHLQRHDAVDCALEPHRAPNVFEATALDF